MVPVLQLWLPILLSTVLVFLVSYVFHVVLPHHKGDHDDLPDEDAVRHALQGVDLPPGDYVIPKARSAADMQDPAFQKKMEEGPVAFLSALPPGPVRMGGQMAQWFVFSLFVGIFAAYVAGRSVGPGGEYLSVFRFAGVTAFVAYSLALWQLPIFYGRKWRWAATFTFDGLIYGLLTAGVFGWLWPG
ncbi:MAG: hypothetical protein PVI57_05465 [Gemmatimonadota bacterium]|jgi:hypothetical protein